jgi:hypothetical protein
METYSRIGLLRSDRNLQSYWTTTKLWKLTVVLEYYEARETYSRIGLLRSYGNLQSYWTTTKLWKLTVVLEYYEAMESYSRIVLITSARVWGLYTPRSHKGHENNASLFKFSIFKSRIWWQTFGNLQSYCNTGQPLKKFREILRVSGLLKLWIWFSNFLR